MQVMFAVYYKLSGIHTNMEIYGFEQIGSVIFPYNLCYRKTEDWSYIC